MSMQGLDLFQLLPAVYRLRDAQLAQSLPLLTPEESATLAALQSFDDYVASEEAIACDVMRLFQGPIADALTHVGQIAMLRRMSGSRIPGENYFAAQIETGRVGPDQAPPKRPF